MVAEQITEIIEGQVAPVNGSGFQLAGRQGWLNVSRYARPVPLLPRQGMRDRVGLDHSGFVRTVGVLPPDGEPPTPEARASELLYLSDEERSPAPGATAARVQPASPPEASPSCPPDRETRIGRLAVLNTAVALLANP